MALVSTGTIRIAGGVLVGGLVTGVLLATAMPTQMKHKAETWRDVIGVREITPGDSSIPVYAPPQDLTPVQWQTAAQEYPLPADQGTALASLYPDAEIDDQADTSYEPLPSELTQANDTDLASVDDDAAASAQAASAAAADVQAQVQDSTSGAPSTAASRPTAAAPLATDAA